MNDHVEDVRSLKDPEKHWRCGRECEASQQRQLVELCDSFWDDVWVWSVSDLPAVNHWEFRITTTNTQPIRRPKYRLSTTEWDFVDSWCKELLAARAIRESQSPYNIPVTDELLSKVAGARMYSGFDAKSAFHQLPIAEEDRHKTPFRGSDRQYEWCRMAMGFKNASQAWQRVMDEALGDLPFVAVYADDICVFSGAAEMSDAEHSKVEAVVKMPPPTDVAGLRRFLGMVGYHGKFIEQVAVKRKPLTKLTGKVPWEWGSEQQRAFEQLKADLVSAPVLRNPDWSRPCILHTDFSGAGLGAVLAQEDDEGQEYVVEFASRTCQGAEPNYASYEASWEVGAVGDEAQGSSRQPELSAWARRRILDTAHEGAADGDLMVVTGELTAGPRRGDPWMNAEAMAELQAGSVNMPRPYARYAWRNNILWYLHKDGTHREPLPHFGMFYRWHLDLAGPFEATRSRNVWVLVMVEAASKWVELVPLRTKEAANIRQAFQERVLARFAAPGEVCTDGGIEFSGEFHELVVEHDIDHPKPLPYHPRPNGLAEGMVKTVKEALMRYVVQPGKRVVAPVFPAQARALFEESAVDFNSPEGMWELMTMRA
eukprot:jgi/Tetstr1/432209/TSEL_021665.t1